MGIKHTFASLKLDGPDATVVRPSNWNADHTIDGDVNFNGFAAINPTLAPVFETVADVAAATISTAYNYLTTYEYATGIGGGATYKRVAIEPTHAGKVQSLDGAWWELLSKPTYVEQFGAVGDGLTDDRAAIQNAIDFVAIGGGELLFSNKTYAISSTILVRANDVRLVGYGGNLGQAGGNPELAKTILKWIGPTGLGMVEFSAIPDVVLGYPISGVGMRHFLIDGNGIANFGLSVCTVLYSEFSDISVRNVSQYCFNLFCRATGVDLNPSAVSSSQYNLFKRLEWSTFDSTPALASFGVYLGGSTNGNQSFNRFVDCHGNHYTGAGWFINYTDNNIFENCSSFGHPAGTGYAFDIQGSSAVTGQGNFSNFYIGCSFPNTRGMILRGIPSGFPDGPKTQVLVTRDRANAQNPPEVQTGGLIDYTEDWNSLAFTNPWTPVVTSSAGAITAYNAGTHSYTTSSNGTLSFEVTILVSNNGTGSGHLIVTLPQASAQADCAVSGMNTSAPAALCGFNNPGSSDLHVYRYDGTYPVASGQFLVISGTYMVAV